MGCIKNKNTFFKNPTWLDIINSESFTSLIKPIRIETETKFTDKNDELIFIANQQSCLLDIETRRLRKIDTVNFPNDLETDHTLFSQNYQRLNDDFTESDLVYEQKVYSQDIDYSNHVNNTVYVRYIMNALSNEFLNKIWIVNPFLYNFYKDTFKY